VSAVADTRVPLRAADVALVTYADPALPRDSTVTR
jgi:hypothetical protein